LSIFEGRLFVCFVLHIEISQTMACRALDIFENPFMSRGGAPSWLCNVLTYGGEDIEYWTIFSLKIYLNQNQKL